MESGTAALRQHTVYEPAMDLAGFVVQASDGRLGQIEGESRIEGEGGAEGGPSGGCARRDGPARSARRLLLPVGTIVSIDLTDRVVHLDRTREQIRRAPTPADAPCYLLREG
ncbi:hypothetical protein [Streptacidiphilus jiangxiensis]|uniref:PRC-barrel domain-containing protein n=1 Tax=Streptacidiphilus jiangxiensis TaxID=235985 RepID=A0A1H7N552_STRJI|nr:hypothetical protein [Streptacidiphilus jiangxiensis]SEL17997.1 hypothetical protein SAMN05414137_106192 [Streptacidiphilus jiangxiensis]